jgi:hypothetical protein
MVRIMHGPGLLARNDLDPLLQGVVCRASCRLLYRGLAGFRPTSKRQLMGGYGSTVGKRRHPAHAQVRCYFFHRFLFSSSQGWRDTPGQSFVRRVRLCSPSPSAVIPPPDLSPSTRKPYPTMSPSCTPPTSGRPRSQLATYTRQGLAHKRSLLIFRAQLCDF